MLVLLWEGSELRDLAFDLPMREIMLHNLLEHQNLIILNLILLLLLSRHLLTLHNPFLAFLLPHANIIPIIIINLDHLDLLISHRLDSIVHILADLILS